MKRRRVVAEIRAKGGKGARVVQSCPPARATDPHWLPYPIRAKTGHASDSKGKEQSYSGDGLWVPSELYRSEHSFPSEGTEVLAKRERGVGPSLDSGGSRVRACVNTLAPPPQKATNIQNGNCNPGSRTPSHLLCCPSGCSFLVDVRKTRSRRLHLESLNVPFSH